MRRSEREITDPAAIDAVIHDAKVCRLALVDDGVPYIVPMNHGYIDGKIYVHSSMEGRKVDILRKSPDVCFQVETDVDAVPPAPGKPRCGFSSRYRCVVGWGRVTFVTDPDEVIAGLDAMLSKYGQGPFEYQPEVLKRTLVLRIDITSMTGKQA